MTAILAVRNEADVLAFVIDDLIAQGVDVYVIDDASEDESAKIAEARLGRGVVAVERRITPRNALDFEWELILRRKEALAAELDADWFMHCDGDEFRESPWFGTTLCEAVERVDRLGFNAIRFEVLNFRPETDAFRPGTDVRESLLRWEAAAEYDAVQIKAWRRNPDVDLASTGGHEASFSGRVICPVPFIIRHYPIRSTPHGNQKVFRDRLARFLPAERERGWHVQYGKGEVTSGFLARSVDLRPFDPVATRAELLMKHTPVGERGPARAAEGMLSVFAQPTLDLAATQQQTRDESRVATEELETRRREAARGDQLVRGLTTELQERSRELSDAQRRVGELLSSRSWRLTEPGRWLYSKVRGLPSPGSRLPAAGPQPLSHVWGVDRGLPIDRHYIETFLARNAVDIKGHVLEVKDSWYATRFGGKGVLDCTVIDVDPTNSSATIIGDLSRAETLPQRHFDCIILTQTLHIIYDIETAFKNVAALLAPSGVLLCTLPAISRVNYEDGGLDHGDYWRLTQAAVRRLCGSAFTAGRFDIETHGNVRVCAAFLYGLAAQELTQDDLTFRDPWFPLIHTVRAVAP